MVLEDITLNAFRQTQNEKYHISPSYVSTGRKETEAKGKREKEQMARKTRKKEGKKKEGRKRQGARKGGRRKGRKKGKEKLQHAQFKNRMLNIKGWKGQKRP